MQHHPLTCGRPSMLGRCLLPLLFALALVLVPGATLPLPAPTYAAAPAGFQVTTVFSGLQNPIDFQFAADGRVFVAEKAGKIKVFDSLADTTPTTFADLSARVYKGPNDHGLLGLALDPAFPSEPYVYTLYTYDAPIGGSAPRWNDVCPDPPGANKNGCVVSGRLSRLQADGSLMTGSEQVLIEDWCQQYTSHSVGALAFGADGALYASAGEGANTSSGDYGQLGYTSLITYTSITPANPCGDPPAGAGGSQTPPSAEGGALRSQDLRSAGDPVTLDGTLIRVDRETGAGLPGNPFFGSADPNARRIVAYGLRNPFRFTIRPGTNEAWISDVGWAKWEEINRVADPTDGNAENFGWPCYEGTIRQPVYDGINLALCESLYGQPGAAAAPYHAYAHAESMAPEDACSPAAPCTSAITGLAFYQGGAYPDAYDGALFFADYGRHGIWVMFKGADGLPDPATRTPFLTDAGGPLTLRIGPDGDLFYADFGGKIYRIQYFQGNQPPIAAAQASPGSGAAPLNVTFDGTASHDPDGDPLSYAWDLDDDGAYDDSNVSRPARIYSQIGNQTIRLKVTDSQGASSTDSVVISVGNTPPAATIDTPVAAMSWKVGDLLAFSGHATDAQDGALGAGALTWSIVLHHCYSPTNCHEHLVQEYPGVAGGTFPVPDHEDLPYLEIRLTATDSAGLTSTDSVKLSPATTSLTLHTSPPALQLLLDSADVTTPLERAVVVGSTHTIIAPETQSHLSFNSWSDDSTERIRMVPIGAAPVEHTARYVNHAPVAAAALGPAGGQPLTVAFSGAASADPEGDSLSYRWEFGDGATSTEPNPAHRYGAPGAYRVTLTVADALGVSGADSFLIGVRSDGTVVLLDETVRLVVIFR